MAMTQRTPSPLLLGHRQALGRSAMSDRALRTTMIVLAMIGLGVASYLTYVHYSGIQPLCSTTHTPA